MNRMAKICAKADGATSPSPGVLSARLPFRAQDTNAVDVMKNGPGAKSEIEGDPLGRRG